MHNEPYYINPNTPDDFWKCLKDAMWIMLFFLIGIALCAILNSCTTHREMINTQDTLYITRTDTFKVTEVKEKKTTEYIDRWRENTYLINPLTGDTTKQVVREKELIYYSQEQHDSIDRYKAMCDSLTRIRNKVEYKEKQLNWWQKFRLDTYIYILISLLALIAVIVYRALNPPKKP